MISRIRVPGFIVLSLAAIVGCAHVPREAGFGDVQRLVGQRTEHRLLWNRESAEDAEMAQAIEALLREELTADAAVQIALLNNRTLQATYEELGVAQAELVQAGLLDNPIFFGKVRWPHRPPSGTNLEFQVAQNFLNLLMLPARKKVAVAQFERTKLRVADEVLRLAAEVEKAYYDVLGAKQVAQMRRLILQAGQASYEMARRLHQAGNLSDLNLATEWGQYEQARVALAKSEVRMLVIRERLTHLMGLWGPQTTWEIPSRLPDLPKDEILLERLESLAIANRLDLAAALQEVQVLAQALGITRDWRWIASADVASSSERDTSRQWVTGPTLSLELPIFDQRQAKISSAEAELRQSQNRMAALAVSIRSEVRSLRDRLLTTRSLVEHYNKVVIPLRERIVALTQQEYDYMLTGVFELLIAKQQEFDAYQEYIEAVRDYWVLRSELQRAAGGRLPSPSAAEPDTQPAAKPAPQSATTPTGGSATPSGGALEAPRGSHLGH